MRCFLELECRIFPIQRSLSLTYLISVSLLHAKPSDFNPACVQSLTNVMALRNLASFVVAVCSIFLCFVVIPVSYEIFVNVSTFFAVIWMSEWLMECIRKTIFNKNVLAENKAVFITGCDSGFGHNLAKRLDSLGYRVFAACLNPTGEGAVALKNSCSSHLMILPLDVTKDQSVQLAKEFVSNNLKNDVLWAVVNNAGIPQTGEIDWCPMEELERVYDVNALGTVRISKAFLPLLRKFRGRLVNLTSAVGQYICPAYTGYCMSKSAAIAFSLGLRVEMMKWGVKVISIEPFFYRTPLTQEESVADLIQRTWDKADPQFTEDYGDAYIQSFKKRSVRFLRRMCSSETHEVIECLEDAITSVEPLSTYYPAYLPHKIGIKLLQSLPPIVTEHYQKLLLDGRGKPIALVKGKYQNGSDS